MIERELTIELTGKLAEQFQVSGLDQDDLERLARWAVAIESYRRGYLSAGMAADLAGADRAEFVASLAARCPSVIDLPDEDIERELSVVDAMMGGGKRP